jgi:alkanesulfonate monooxygenase SsuD/methylene tetrahydromethanopterin reductase-like flavin-dependent oxidoreductase (luciferase family)
MSRIGIPVSGGASPSEIVDCVKLAEELGYESAWVAKASGGTLHRGITGIRLGITPFPAVP